MAIGPLRFQNGQSDRISYWELWQRVAPRQSYVLYTTANSHLQRTAHDPSTRYVREPLTMRRVPRLTQALLDAGYDDDSVQKFLAGNVFRYFDRVWAPTAQHSA